MPASSIDRDWRANNRHRLTPPGTQRHTGAVSKRPFSHAVGRSQNGARSQEPFLNPIFLENSASAFRRNGAYADKGPILARGAVGPPTAHVAFSSAEAGGKYFREKIGQRGNDRVEESFQFSIRDSFTSNAAAPGVVSCRCGITMSAALADKGARGSQGGRRAVVLLGGRSARPPRATVARLRFSDLYCTYTPIRCRTTSLKIVSEGAPTWLCPVARTGTASWR